MKGHAAHIQPFTLAGTGQIMMHNIECCYTGHIPNLPIIHLKYQYVHYG